MKGQHVDLSSPAPGEPPVTVPPQADRGFLGIHFTCCGVYHRIYKNHTGTAYQGNCPRCSKALRVKIGPGGSDSRFFTAS